MSLLDHSELIRLEHIGVPLMLRVLCRTKACVCFHILFYMKLPQWLHQQNESIDGLVHNCSISGALASVCRWDYFTGDKMLVFVVKFSSFEDFSIWTLCVILMDTFFITERRSELTSQPQQSNEPPNILVQFPDCASEARWKENLD